MKLGWWLIALIGIAMFAYAMNRGLFTGSNIVQFKGGDVTYFARDCQYLFPSGVVTFRKGGWHERAEAENEYCPLFRL